VNDRDSSLPCSKDYIIKFQGSLTCNLDYNDVAITILKHVDYIQNIIHLSFEKFGMTFGNLIHFKMESILYNINP